jgi:glycosyltransferase involved in cell wall biosynthesis
MEYEKKAKELGYLNRTVFFTGEIPYEEVARQMKTAHCLILNSNIENSPCVIGEALCCGLPVIATSVGGIPELVNENQGILIAPNDTKALVDAMDKMKKEYTTFNRKTFAAEASRKFSFAAVSKKFDEVYGNVFK